MIGSFPSYSDYPTEPFTDVIGVVTVASATATTTAAAVFFSRSTLK